ncbi:recombinase family protein [Actinomadura formosensis]|uniref:recombinase family protein n=1 Tax=Actinomadura formosensis TaxID=60706 RepID=UPI003D918181
MSSRARRAGHDRARWPAPTTPAGSPRFPGLRSCCASRPRPTAHPEPRGGPALRRRHRSPATGHRPTSGSGTPAAPGSPRNSNHSWTPWRPTPSPARRSSPRRSLPRVKVRPQFEKAPAAARQIKAHAPHCRVIVTVYEMKRLGRDASELTALADHLTAHGLVLEMLAGPGRMLFAFFAAMAKTEREAIREATLEGLDAAARKGNHGGRRPVITNDMLHTLLRRKAAGEKVDDIRKDLIIPTGKNKGQNPSLASIYRALAAHDKATAHPQAVQQAHADFAALTQSFTALT